LKQRIIVAIDGPAGAGKSTIARAVAAALGSVYIDTGAMYRAVAVRGVRENADPADEERMAAIASAAEIELAPEGRVLLDGEDVSAGIRTPEIAQLASKVSALPGVRRAMVALQRRMAESVPVVMEGRDIGTVVFPNAQVKIFLDATPEVRAARRVRDMRERGIEADPAKVAEEIRERDHRDRNRAEAPLTQAADAVYLDSSGMTIDQVVEAVLSIADGKALKGSLEK
jgi:cytidylate kinase